LNTLRQNPHLFWNLVYYFSETKIPLEFLLPYRDSALFKLLPEMIDSSNPLSKQVCMENTRRHGLYYLDAFVALEKAQKQNILRFESLRELMPGHTSSSRGHAQPRQAAAAATNVTVAEQPQDRLSVKRMTGVSSNLRNRSRGSSRSKESGSVQRVSQLGAETSNKKKFAGGRSRQSKRNNAGDGHKK